MEAPKPYNLIVEVTYHHFCCFLLVTHTNSGVIWERTTQEREYQEAKIIRGSLDLPHGVVMVMRIKKDNACEHVM